MSEIKKMNLNNKAKTTEESINKEENINNMEIPDVAKVEEKATKSYIKEEEPEEGRKLFQNKKANIGFIILGVIVLVVLILMFLVAKTNLIV